MWVYVDGIVLHAPLPSLPGLSHAVEQGVTQDLGGALTKPKSALPVPCLASAPWHEWPQDYKRAAALQMGADPTAPAQRDQGPTLPTREDGLAILGSDIASSWAVNVGPGAAAAEPGRAERGAR